MKRLLLPLLLTATAFAQGPLVPPSTSGPQVGPVAPLDGSGNPQANMKTLYQVEPRTPVQSLAVSAPYTIGQPGSYYLTGNITVASGDAIVITSDDVSLDLNGFTIKSTFSGGTSGTAVYVSGSHSRLTIRKGSIVSSTTVPASGSPTYGGFGNGIFSNGIISQALVSEIHVTGAGVSGIYLDVQGVAERCTVANSGDTGIVAEEVRDCSAKNCYGVAIQAQASATNCSGTSTNGTGLYAVQNATNCSGASTNGNGAYVANNALNCSATSIYGYGLFVINNATNCFGTSTNGTGLYSGRNATNCSGVTLGNSGKGLWVIGTATTCYAQYPGGGSSATGLKAAIAIGCTYTAGGNGLDVPVGKSFNM